MCRRLQSICAWVLATSMMAAVLALSPAARADPTTWGHLLPADGPFTSNELHDAYTTFVAQSLFRGRAVYRRIQMVILPPTAGEVAVFIEEENERCVDKATVVVAEAQGNMGLAAQRPGSSQPGPPYEWKGLHVDVHWTMAAIDCRSAQLLDDLWEAAIDDVRYRPRVRGVVEGMLDATEYDFATHKRAYGWRAGVALSPAPATVPGKLVEVGSLLIAYARAPADQQGIVLNRLVAQARGLLAELRGNR